MHLPILDTKRRRPHAGRRRSGLVGEIQRRVSIEEAERAELELVHRLEGDFVWFKLAFVL